MRFALFCKSFREDFERLSILVNSFENHNPERLVIYVCVPDSDRQIFLDRVGSGRVELLTDRQLVEQTRAQSWKHQQLVKMNAFREDLADALFIVNSDTYFFRDVTRSDFIRADGSVAMVASCVEHIFDENWELLANYLDDRAAIAPLTLEQLGVNVHARAGRIHWYHRVADVILRPSYHSRRVRPSRFFGRHGISYAPLPGAIWTKESLESLRRDVLEPRHLKFEHLLDYCPWEAYWVAEWELLRGLPGRHLVEPLLVHLRRDTTILRASREGVTQARLARRYLGAQLAARHQKLHRLLA